MLQESVAEKKNYPTEKPSVRSYVIVLKQT